MLRPGGHNIPFRLLKEGQCGLVYFYQDSCPTRPKEDNHPTFTYQVGMYGATNYTGVYSALSEQCCFAADIKSYVCDPASSSIRHKVSKLEGLDLKKQITDRLHAQLSRMEFNVTNVGVTKPYIIRPLFMVNPNMHHPDGSEQVGAYVAQAVWDYLGLKKEHYPVDIKHSGFVLQHQQKPLVSLAAAQKEGGEKPSELDLFEETEEEGEHIGDWTFEVELKEDWEADKEQAS